MKKIFIFTENTSRCNNADSFKQTFHGVCMGHKLKKINLVFCQGKVDLAIGYYIFKIGVTKIESGVLSGMIESYKYFSE